jgi:hypothetical protein
VASSLSPPRHYILLQFCTDNIVFLVDCTNKDLLKKKKKCLLIEIFLLFFGRNQILPVTASPKKELGLSVLKGCKKFFQIFQGVRT